MVCTLEVLARTSLGEGSSDWPLLVTRLHQAGLVDAGTTGAVERLWWFGRLIANTDMHLGNLSFHLTPKSASPLPACCLSLAPAYDMLPMAYAPLPSGEVPPREFLPPLPLPAQIETWKIACNAALAFWHRASTDKRISAPFQALCLGNYRRLNEIAARL